MLIKGEKILEGKAPHSGSARLEPPIKGLEKNLLI